MTEFFNHAAALLYMMYSGAAHWAVYQASYTFYFWIAPFAFINLYMRKHLHAGMMLFVWGLIHVSLHGKDLVPGNIEAFYIWALIMVWMCINTWWCFLVYFAGPYTWRSQSWVRLNRWWLVIFGAITYAIITGSKGKSSGRVAGKDFDLGP